MRYFATILLIGLRDYGTASWEGGTDGCEHTGVSRRCDKEGRNDKQSTQKGSSSDKVSRTCLLCGAKRIDQQIGIEASPQAFVQTLVGVFAEVHRVLKDDGVCFVNLADSYYNYRPGAGQSLVRQTLARNNQDLPAICSRRANRLDGLKEKDMCLIPQRFVIAMQEAGWWVRDQICWVKKAPMPESVRDRFTKSWEPVFMFTKSAKYFFDVDSVKEIAIEGKDLGLLRGKQFTDKEKIAAHSPSILKRQELLIDSRSAGNGFRQMRNSWILGPEPTADAHFAVFPTTIPRRCILATTKPGDTVLDCFGGSGTTGMVAIELGRKAILCELNPEYVKLINRRTTTTIGFAFEDMTC